MIDMIDMIDMMTMIYMMTMIDMITDTKIGVQVIEEGNLDANVHIFRLFRSLRQTL